MGGLLGMKGGMPSEAQIEKAREEMSAQGGLPKGLPGMGGGMQLPPGLSGFGKKK